MERKISAGQFGVLDDLDSGLWDRQRIIPEVKEEWGQVMKALVIYIDWILVF